MRVVVTDRKYPNYPDPFSDVVNTAGGELTYATVTSRDELIEGCRNADVILTCKAPITREVIEKIGDVEGIIRLGTGCDTIDIKAASDHGIPVSNVPGRYCRDNLTVHVIGLMIGAAHELAYSDREMRTSNGWGERRPINPMYGGTFGVIGLGCIGRAVVPKAQGLNMEVIGYDPYASRDLFAHLDVEKVTFDALLARADCISIHAPLTAETHHMFAEKEFQRMKETAVLVNTARGPLVDERALVDAVKMGEIWAAGLDVFETEPPVNSPALDCDRIVCSPHHGGKCEQGERNLIEIVRAELNRALTGEHLENVVNPEALKYGDELLNPEPNEWS